VNAARGPSDKKIKEIDEMNSIGKGDAGVRAWTLESVKFSTQRLKPAKLVLCDRVAQPERCGIESKNVSDLENAPVAIRDIG
jgi:hypothetical protein